jgi:predicted RNA-binding protein with PUA-like domain
MNYWLVKSEPFVFSYDDLVRDGVTVWEGVRNYQARNNLRAMRVDDLCLFYHSNEGLAIVGIARVSAEAYPDSTAEKGDWSVVELQPYKATKRHLTLAEIKAHPAMQDLLLVRNPRLSVMPIGYDEFFTLLDLCETTI